MRLVQLQGAAGRRLAVVEEPSLRLLEACTSVYDLAWQCLQEGTTLREGVESRHSATLLAYDAIYQGASGWRLCPSAGVPTEPARCLVSGTGLTHLRSARNRDAMHAGAQAVTDSTRMYEAGVAGGKPPSGQAGAAPEWFYKGCGSILRAHNQPLTIPAFAADGGEEAEIAGVYLVDAAGVPRRIGFTAGNEFSDHLLERQNYLYLAASKLRCCAIGPELVVDADFGSITGHAAIYRAGDRIWSRDLRTGEAAMCHSLANLEHHHFKYDAHRRPGDMHIHFFGADSFSFADGIRLEDGDIMEIAFEGFGRALRNPLERAQAEPGIITVQTI